MADRPIRCPQCKRTVEKPVSAINRARHIGAPLYCGRHCSGLARRRVDPRTPEQKKADKAAYDLRYRTENREWKRELARDWYLRNRDPEKARLIRQKRMKWHVEYCRRYYADPKRKAAKVRYDERRRSAKYLDYAECHRLYVQLCKLIRKLQPNKYERMKARGYEFNKSTKRKRACKQITISMQST